MSFEGSPSGAASDTGDSGRSPPLSHADGRPGNAYAKAAPTSGGSAPRIRRRNRMITSCLECRRRKLKCDKQHPCQNCTKTKRDCVFLAPALDSASQLKLTEIKEKMGSLERDLEVEVGRNGAWREARKSHGDDDDYGVIPDDEKDLEPAPMAMTDAVYERGDDEADDDMADVGFALGKVRLTDRIGGYLRPRFGKEMGVSLSSPLRGENFRNDVGSPMSRPAAERASTFLAPGPTYLPPASSMFFGTSAKSHSLIDYLPASNAADLLIQQYKTAVHPITKVMHWPTFQKRYDQFWNDLRIGVEPVGSLQAIIFATMFSGLISFSEDEVLQHFAVSKKELVLHFQQGTEAALGRAQFLRTTKVETMQAFVMYLIPLCRDQLSRAHSALVGTAIRLAQCMGLHRDGVAYGMDAVELHIRRMIWYQICMLDIRTCEAQGPQPGIREGDFDTKFPLNINDEDLLKSAPPTKDAPQWTDMTCTLIRMECNEMHRRVWAERPRVEKKLISLTSLIGKIQNFRNHLEQRYLPMMEETQPIHRAAHLIIIVLTTRMHIMVLHRYYDRDPSRFPNRLRQVIRMTGLESMEAARALETEPALATFRWFAGAVQQYHVAFLLLVDNNANPGNPESDRIWAMVDYVFELPEHLTRAQKSAFILTELHDRMEVYSAARKLRIPVGLQKHYSNDNQNDFSTPPPLPRGRSSTHSPDPVPDVNQIDPNGKAHVSAIMGAMGLSNGSYTANNMEHSQPVYDNKSLTASPPQSHAEFGPSYRLSPNFSQPTQLLQQMAPPSLSDELMAEIDWAEWDKFFPSTAASQAQQPIAYYPTTSGPPQLRYG